MINMISNLKLNSFTLILLCFSASFFSFFAKADSYDDFYKRTKALINTGKHDSATIEKIKNETIGQNQMNAANEVNRQVIESNKKQLAKKLKKTDRSKKTPEAVNTVDSIMKNRNEGKRVTNTPVTTTTTSNKPSVIKKTTESIVLSENLPIVDMFNLDY